MKAQPGQRRSGQAGSEPCLSSGDWRGRSVGREEAGREDAAPKSSTVADADAVSLAEGSIRTTATARSLGAAGVPSPGHAFTRIPQEPGRPPVSSRETGRARLTAKGPAPAGRDAPARGNERASRGEVPRRRGRPETAGMGREESYDPHRTEEGGELVRARTHWREGGEQTDALVEGDMPVPRDRARMSPELDRLAELARGQKAVPFTSIAHLLTVAALARAFHRLRKEASAGVDGVTYAEYDRQARENLQQLHDRLRSGRYRAQPLRRVYIPKEAGGERPISIPALEDKIVQRAVLELLEAIYEQDFLGCSYGFRPGRSAQEALDEIGRVICRRPIRYVVEADICAYFDAIVRSQLMEWIEKRVRDGSMLRLIGKWIHAGILEDGRLLVTQTGVGQGQVISPLLANIYLHYVLDEWFEDVVKPRLRGEAYEIRYADDFILCFQYREDAEKVLAVLGKRFAKYGLTLHPEKTRLLEFGREAWRQWEEAGGPKPGTFDFLGFTHIGRRSRRGNFTVHVRTIRKRLRQSLKRVSAWCQRHRHDPVVEQWRALNAKLRGHYQYYGRATNFRRLWAFYRAVRRIWRKWLNRRTRGKSLPWRVYEELLASHPLQRPYIARPWASAGSHV